MATPCATRLLAMAVAITAIGIASSSRAEETMAASIVVRIRDYAGLSSGSLSRAKEETTKVFARVRVTTIWLDDATAVPPADAGRELHVVILSWEMGNRKITADHVALGVMGQASHATGRAYVFQHRVREASIRYSACFDVLLGKVIAHELGHLLLANGHTDRGIMSESMLARSHVSEYFTTREAGEIRLALAPPLVRWPSSARQFDNHEEGR